MNITQPYLDFAFKALNAIKPILRGHFGTPNLDQNKIGWNGGDRY